MKIYTRTGDKGTSSLYNGERRSKDDAIFQALGSVDELSSMLGLAREFIKEEKPIQSLAGNIQTIQSALQDLNSSIATPRGNSSEFKHAKTAFDIDGKRTVALEQWIDDMDKDLPALTNFILPSGGKPASALHVCRGISRRAERDIVPLVREGTAEQSVGIYVNRLSDYLFMAARFACHATGRTEEIYKKE